MVSGSLNQACAQYGELLTGARSAEDFTTATGSDASSLAAASSVVRASPPICAETRMKRMSCGQQASTVSSVNKISCARPVGLAPAACQRSQGCVSIADWANIGITWSTFGYFAASAFIESANAASSTARSAFGPAPESWACASTLCFSSPGGRATAPQTVGSHTPADAHTQCCTATVPAMNAAPIGRPYRQSG